MFGSAEERQKLERRIVALEAALESEQRAAKIQRRGDLDLLALERKEVERLRAELAMVRGRGDLHLTRAVSAAERVAELERRCAEFERRCAAGESAGESAVAERRIACDAARALEKELAAARRSLAEALESVASVAAESEMLRRRGGLPSHAPALAKRERPTTAVLTQVIERKRSRSLGSGVPIFSDVGKVARIQTM